MRHTVKSLFAPRAMALELDMLAGRAEAGDESETSTLPDLLEFRTVETSRGAFGYLRIRSFMSRPQPFVDEVVRILGLLPPDGLIIDVRGNGGGIIPAGEQLLQLLTPRLIEHERLHFLNTDLTEQVVAAIPSLARWADSIGEKAFETGAVFSEGWPIGPDSVDACNQIGQRYYGPVVLVTDALCCSTTDIFATGLQDHEIGPVLGRHSLTGAGGANVWTHSYLLQLLSEETAALAPLPKGTSLQVATRRTTRVETHAGGTLEDLGVVPTRSTR